MVKHVLFNNLKYGKDKNTGYYLCTKNVNGRRERLHRAVWSYYNGEIPKGYHVHHVDENKENNDISNLQLIISKDHESYHGSEPEHIKILVKSLPLAREKARIWHKSDEGRNVHSKTAKISYEKMSTVIKTCETCGNEFRVKAIKQVDSRFCSNACKSAWRRKEGLDDETKKCLHCGKDFTSNKYDQVKTCSKSCAAKLRWAGRNKS